MFVKDFAKEKIRTFRQILYLV